MRKTSKQYLFLFVSKFQTRMLFNQVFVRGLQISRIGATITKTRFWATVRALARG
ncbi:hypothetical protein MTR_1g068690 [Medicago truncatula]|uniref:Uncharacterized protein n=1 Tax=Medicago truncatula TaxID=3880 RepID=G7IBN0_MEDTR|nr:hypothetical protein MTR_1g068690 [Medicago truncatula]